MELEDFFELYDKSHEAARRVSVRTGNIEYLQIATFAMNTEEDLVSLTDFDCLHDKDYQLKINEYNRTLLDAITKLKEATFSAYKVKNGEEHEDVRKENYEQYYLAHDALILAYNEILRYHNKKIKGLS